METDCTRSPVRHFGWVEQSIDESVLTILLWELLISKRPCVYKDGLWRTCRDFSEMRGTSREPSQSQLGVSTNRRPAMLIAREWLSWRKNAEMIPGLRLKLDLLDSWVSKRQALASVQSRSWASPSVVPRHICRTVTPNLAEPGQTWPSQWTSRRSCGIGPITARAADLQGGDAKPGQADGRAEVVGSVQSLYMQLTYREVTPNLAKPMNMQKKLRDWPQSPQNTAELQNAESLLAMRSKHIKGSK